MNYACSDVSKHFGGVRALNEVSLSVSSGEIRALFGGNGSGKSTLAKIIGGYVSPDGNSKLLIDGKQIAVGSPADAKRHGIVVTSQELSLFYNLRTDLNVCLSSLPAATIPGVLNHRKIVEKAKGSLSRIHEEGLLFRKLAQLQENKKYMMEFAKALSQEVGLLIVDEITSPLFGEEFTVVKDVLMGLKDRGVAIIFISHRMGEIYSFCDSVSVLRNGEHIKTDLLRNIDKDELLRLMTGKEKANGLGETAESLANPVSSAGGYPAEKGLLLAVDQLSLPGYSGHLSLRVRKGEFVGIAGLQGQGQSEVVRALFGLYGHQRYELDGKEVLIRSPREAIRRGIGFISGNRELEGVFRDRSLQENLEIVKRCVLHRGKIATRTVMEDYKIIAEHPQSPISSLSGGNQQKVIIGRWLTLDPKVLLADDPNKGVDVQARSDIHLLLEKIVGRGHSIVMVSSDDEELAAIGRRIANARILIMYHGEVVRELTGDEITVFNIVNYSHPTEAKEP